MMKGVAAAIAVYDNHPPPNRRCGCCNEAGFDMMKCPIVGQGLSHRRAGGRLRKHSASACSNGVARAPFGAGSGALLLGTAFSPRPGSARFLVRRSVGRRHRERRGKCLDRRRPEPIGAALYSIGIPKDSGCATRRRSRETSTSSS